MFGSKKHSVKVVSLGTLPILLIYLLTLLSDPIMTNGVLAFVIRMNGAVNGPMMISSSTSAARNTIRSAVTSKSTNQGRIGTAISSSGNTLATAAVSTMRPAVVLSQFGSSEPSSPSQQSSIGTNLTPPPPPALRKFLSRSNSSSSTGGSSSSGSRSSNTFFPKMNLPYEKNRYQNNNNDYNRTTTDMKNGGAANVRYVSSHSSGSFEDDDLDAAFDNVLSSSSSSSSSRADKKYAVSSTPTSVRT
jgi:hypothetical protein